VEIGPSDTAQRASDEQIAICAIDLKEHVPDVQMAAQIDLHRVQIMRLDPATGEPQPYAMNAYQTSKFDRPWRFYDASLGDEFPTYNGYLSLDSQRNPPQFRREMLPFGHRVFNALGEGRRGKLVWAHTAEPGQRSRYAIYFDVLPQDTIPASPPAAFVGDGGNRIVKESRRSGPPGNVAACAADWNEDGLVDVIFGAASAYLMVLENTGKRDSPVFQRRFLLYDSEGAPIDVGYDSYPHVTDWNGDGRREGVHRLLPERGE
jgi:hypothetical protein